MEQTMPGQGFFRRWARLKAQAGVAEAGVPAEPQARAELAPVAQTSPHPPVAPRPSGAACPAAPAAPPRPLPSLEDVARLNADSDFSAFVTQGVDKAVQRLAMKKLFSDPHFNLMDGLDTYIDDFNKPDPVPAAMMASLQHARSLFAQPAKDEQAADGAGLPPPPLRPDGAPALQPPQSPQSAQPPQSPQSPKADT
jgi:hypothetical protein